MITLPSDFSAHQTFLPNNRTRYPKFYNPHTYCAPSTCARSSNSHLIYQYPIPTPNDRNFLSIHRSRMEGSKCLGETSLLHIFSNGIDVIASYDPRAAIFFPAEQDRYQRRRDGVYAKIVFQIIQIKKLFDCIFLFSIFP